MTAHNHSKQSDVPSRPLTAQHARTTLSHIQTSSYPHKNKVSKSLQISKSANPSFDRVWQECGMLWMNRTWPPQRLIQLCYLSMRKSLYSSTKETSRETTEEKLGCNNHSCTLVFADRRQKRGRPSEPLPSMKKRHWARSWLASGLHRPQGNAFFFFYFYYFFVLYFTQRKQNFYVLCEWFLRVV